jgi:hypothetical protein
VSIKMTHIILWVILLRKDEIVKGALVPKQLGLRDIVDYREKHP